MARQRLGLLVLSLALALSLAAETLAQGASAPCPEDPSCPDLQAMIEVTQALKMPPSAAGYGQSCSCMCNGTQKVWKDTSYNYGCSNGRVTLFDVDTYKYPDQEVPVPESISKLRALTALYLRSNYLTGTLPASVSLLENLTSVIVKSDNITGDLPIVLSPLQNLKSMDIWCNTANGEAPASVTLLKNLTYMSVSGTSKAFLGTIPDSWSVMTGIQTLGFSNSKQGTLPQWLTIFKNLKAMYMSNAGLSGTLPEWLSDITTLETLSMSNNSITGALPQWLTRLGGIKSLYLNDNNFTGTLPDEYSSLINIGQMQLSRNRHLGGTLPTGWSELVNMSSLLLSETKLYGTLPSEWSTMSKIYSLDVSHARLEGTLPAAYSTWIRANTLQLSNNSLTGTIPEAWSALTIRTLGLSDNSLKGPLHGSFSAMRLAYMLLHNNFFEGSLPASWGNMTNMLYMQLHNNSFSGTLPSSWSRLENITSLSFHNNNIIGELPPSWSEFSSIRMMSLQNNSINGSLPASWSEMKQLGKLDVSENSLTGSLPDAWSELIQLQILDVSKNNIVGSVPAAWSALNALQYLGIHGNKFLVNPSYNLMISPAGWQNLSYLSTEGGGFIPEAWCNSTQLPNSRSGPELLFVGLQPVFDGCMERICVAHRPQDYKVRYLQDFNFYEGQLRVVNSSATEGFIKKLGDIYLKDQIPFMLKALANDTQTTLASLDKMVQFFGDGWMLGDGGYYDPCVDRAAINNTTIVFTVFGIAVLAILVDWGWQAMGGAGFVGCAKMLISLFWKKNNSLQDKSSKDKSGTGNAPAEVGSKTMERLRRAAAFSHSLFVVYGFVKPYTSTLMDVVFDLVLVREIWPYKTAYLLLGTFLLSDWLSATVMYLRMYQQHKKPAAGNMKSPSMLARQLSQAATSTGLPALALRTVLAVALIPIFSIGMHIMAACVGILILVSLVKMQVKEEWIILRLDVKKCVIFRSFVVGFVEAPAAIAFSTWAYLAPYKRDVGKYISRRAFYTSLATSMLHVVLELWHFKEIMLENGNSLAASLKEISNLAATEETHMVVAVSDTKAGPQAGAVKDVERP